MSDDKAEEQPPLVTIPGELEPCPHCGGKDILACIEGGQHVVVCLSCRCCGKVSATPEEAVGTWNKRPT